MALQVPVRLTSIVSCQSAAHLQDRFEHLDAGIGEQDIEPAKGRARLCGRGAQRRKITLIDTGFAPARAGGFNQAAGLREFVGRRGLNLERRADRSGNVDAHHIGALARKGDRRGAPDPAGRASDDGCFAPHARSCFVVFDRLGRFFSVCARLPLIRGGSVAP
jgi:hypothetical protein